MNKNAEAPRVSRRQLNKGDLTRANPPSIRLLQSLLGIEVFEVRILVSQSMFVDRNSISVRLRDNHQRREPPIGAAFEPE